MRDYGYKYRKTENGSVENREYKILDYTLLVLTIMMWVGICYVSLYNLLTAEWPY